MYLPFCPGYYVPARTPPIYSSATGYGTPYGAGGYSRMRDKPSDGGAAATGTGTSGGGRPISADVGRLFSVQEDPSSTAAAVAAAAARGGAHGYSPQQERKEERFKKGEWM